MSQDIWSFKYEPKKLEDMILNPDIRPKLKKALTEIPNLLLYGSAGIGKGTFTKILLEETGLIYMWLNASDKTGIEFIRNDVKPFVHGASKDLKVVVLNEADALSSGQSGAQKILRQLMEDTHNISRYIFLANYEQYIIPEIKSRCEVIAIDNPPIKEIALFASRILKAENIDFEPKTLAAIVKKCYPDIRKTIWALQENSIDGKLKDSRIFSSEDIFREILDYILKGDLENIRRMLRSNYINYIQLYEFLYDNFDKFDAPAAAIMKIGEWMRWDPQVANKEIHFMYMVSEMYWHKVVELKK